MERYIYTDRESMNRLLVRPHLDRERLYRQVKDVFDRIEKKGDEAVRFYAGKYDGYTPESLEITEKEIYQSEMQVSVPLKKAMQLSADNIRRFHENQRLNEVPVVTVPGVICWRESRPVDAIGLYIPGGRTPLFSTVLMLGIPASLAGCRNIVMCTPPDKRGNIAPVILYSARLAGVQRIFRIGGIQAVAAMALGTETIPKVDKIFGPGNQYVTAAKQWAQQNGTAIDIPAGPSEVLVIADETADPVWVAADLLSQAEHGTDSQVVLVTWVETLAVKVEEEVGKQLEELPRKEIASHSLEYGKIIICRTAGEALDISNNYAPEHLILAVKNPEEMLKDIIHAGSVFLGHYAPVSAGDYASGTNHTLPTNGYARVYGGVSLDSYIKKMTVQKISAEGLQSIGPAIEVMAEAEKLEGHSRAVSIRLKDKR